MAYILVLTIEKYAFLNVLLLITVEALKVKNKYFMALF